MGSNVQVVAVLGPRPELLLQEVAGLDELAHEGALVGRRARRQ